MALPSHRYYEVSQFVALSGAVACAMPDRLGDFAFAPLVDRLARREPGAAAGDPPRRGAGGLPLARRLIDAAADPLAGRASAHPGAHRPHRPRRVPALGRHHRHPEAHPPHAQRLRLQLEARLGRPSIEADSALLLVLPIAHNLPLACPGLQGCVLHGARGGAEHQRPRPADVFALVERHRVTHIAVVPALLIRWINDPAIARLRPLLAAGRSRAAASGCSRRSASRRRS